uniref:EF-hand domain-containing protein n=1 Tax=Haptolina brevifila TaxID=156173 RepID=A0A7S2HNT9_9EUKA|mmetsp:Transcript_56325/g.111833  ORF Transcript_56325/g.111833 Transcript_56325/m.111833 type:complete len:170 (+) Transcript_56325:86-595(+)
MGAGASKGLQAMIDSMSVDELRGVMDKLSAETKSKIEMAIEDGKPREGKMSENNKKTLTVLEDLITAVQEAEQDRKFSESAGLAPARQMKQRRRSKELQLQLAEIMGPQLEEIFKAIDTDGNGHLDMAELKTAFQQIGKPYNAHSFSRHSISHRPDRPTRPAPNLSRHS